jgi:hypothetical protein
VIDRKKGSEWNKFSEARSDRGYLVTEIHGRLVRERFMATRGAVDAAQQGFHPGPDAKRGTAFTVPRLSVSARFSLCWIRSIGDPREMLRRLFCRLLALLRS